MKKSYLKFIITLILGIFTAYLTGAENISANTYMIEIESKNTYSDMTSSYSDGYRPIVKDGKVHVVLPLSADGYFYYPLTVTADVGTSGPLIAANQRKQIEYSHYDSTLGKYIYVIEFDFDLASSYNSGTYTVNFSITGYDYEDVKVSENFTVYVVLDDGKGSFNLEISNDKVYKGMNRSYQDGYIPTIENDTATVILPLKVNGKYTGKLDVTARTTDSLVFSGVNYSKTFSKNSDGIYLVEFKLPLNKDRKNGSYAVEFSVTADSSTFNFTVYVIVSDSEYDISIVNNVVYEGMNCSYQDGYKPTIENDTAKVILPLLVSGNYNGILSVTSRTTDSTVFSGVNYTKTFSRQSDSNYLVEFELPLNDSRKNGAYAVELSATAGNSTYSFTVYVVISDSDYKISIVNDVIYEGMNNSYQDGYIPTIENDTATIILPLLVSGDYDGTLSVTTRTTDSTVFGGVNYNKMFKKHSDGNYLITFDLPLKVSRKNGSYAVEFTVVANSSTYSFTVYVVVNDEVANGFYIDNQNVYANMDLSYANGYKPTVTSDKATVILPIKTESKMQGDIKVKADITDNTNETFEMRNYEKTVSLGTNGVYLAKFDFNLLSTSKNGVYTVKFSVSGKTATGETLEETFTIYVTVSNAAGSSSTPNIIVESFSVDDHYLAGEDFTSVLALKNININTKAHNIQIKVTTGSQGIEFLNSTNSIYYENMESNSLSLDLKFKALSDASTGKHSINLDITYEDENGSSRSLSSVVYVNIRQIPSVEVETNGLDSRITAGDTVTLTTDVYNTGKSSIYNVTLKVEGYGLLPSKSGYIGTMNAESGQSISIDVFVGSKTMSSDYTGTEKYGFTEGKIIMTYEDAEGNEYMEEYKINTQIAAPASSDSTTTSTSTESSWWISLIACACILVFTGVYLFFTKNRKKLGTV